MHATRTPEEQSRIAWSDVEAEWREREFNTLRRAASAVDGLAIDDVDELLFAERPPTEEEALRVLTDAFAAATATPDSPFLLAMYVHGRCLEKWEESEDYLRIRLVLGALRRTAAGCDSEDGAARGELLSIIVSQAQAIDRAMAVEDGMSCSCPVAVGTRSREVVTMLDAVLEKERLLGSDLVGPRAVVRADAETTRHYFRTIADLAEAVLAFVIEDAPGRSDFFDSVLDELGGALESGDVYESELQAHRASLEALRDTAAQPRLRIDAAELVYLYPFALDGIDAREAVSRTLGEQVTEALASIGLDSTSHELDVNDLWDRQDVPEHGYSGASIELPPITTETTAGELLEFTAEVRMSSLGNHHLHVRSRLADAGLHEVNQALRRGSHAMGEEKLTSGTRSWTKFPHYADDVVRTIAGVFGAKLVVNLNATFHVVLGARSISVQRENASASSATLDDLERAVGASLLFHPVGHLATSLEEWIRYPPPTITNLVTEQGYSGDLVARTDNTTVSFMPASPEWLVDEYEEMIEFVASIPPLLTLWETHAVRLAEELDAALRGDVSIESLHEHELAILGLEQEIGRNLAFLHSQALCRTRGQRRFLDELSRAAGLPALEKELDGRLRQLTDRQKRIAAIVRRKQQEHDERLSRRVEFVLTVLAAASLAGVAVWINDAFRVEARTWAWVETISLTAITIAIAVVITFGRRRR